MKRRTQRGLPHTAMLPCLGVIIAAVLAPGVAHAATQDPSPPGTPSMTLAQRYGEGQVEEQDDPDAATTQKPYGTGYESRFERMDRFERPERATRIERPERPPAVNRPERPERGSGR